jgi:hypothetical protein
MPELLMSRGTLAALAAFLFVATPVQALDYKTWSRATAGFKGGYVLALAEYYGTVAQAPKTEAFETVEAYRECFAGTDSHWLAQQVEGFVARNPALAEQEMVFVAHAAFREICKVMLEKRATAH